MNLYYSPEVQRFLNGLPVKELQSDKEIYKHGTLRKVCKDWVLIIIIIIIITLQLSKRTVKFKDLTIQLDDYGTVTIEEIKKNQTLSVLCSSVSEKTSVCPCKAVVNTDGDLINVGDFVKYCVPSPSYSEVIWLSID